MTPLTVLKKVRRALRNPKNFAGMWPCQDRPHCVVGEIKLQENIQLPFKDTLSYTAFTTKEAQKLMKATITHKTALRILDAAIRRLEK